MNEVGWLDGARGHRGGPGSSYEEASDWGVLAYSVRQSQTLQNLKDREVATTEDNDPTCTSSLGLHLQLQHLFCCDKNERATATDMHPASSLYVLAVAVSV